MSNKLLEPGYQGELLPEELAFIAERLRADRRLRIAWGFYGPGQRRVSQEGVRAVAMHGDPDDREHNRRLVASTRNMARKGTQLGFPDTTKNTLPRLGYPSRVTGAGVAETRGTR